MDCSDVCLTVARLVSRHPGGREEFILRALELAAQTCRACAEECERRASLCECLEPCAKECRGCQEACTLAMQDLGGETGLVQTN